MYYPPVDPNTGLPAEVSFEDFAVVWRGLRSWRRHRKAAALSRRARSLSDNELRSVGLARVAGGAN